MEKRTSKASASIGKFIGAAAGIAAAVGIFRTLRGAVDQAFSRIDTMEQFDRVMTTMTGSAEVAEQTLATINDTVKGTAFGLDTAASAVQNFVTSGIEVESATRYFESWGDAVAFYTKGTSQDLEGVTDALSKMSTRGKVDMEQLGRIMEAGIPAMDIYAEAMGMSTEEVADQMRKGKLEAGQFMEVMDEALANGTEKFPALAGAAKDAGASWQGSFDNMKAAVARGVTNIIESIDTMLEDNGLPTMREMVSEFGSAFESALTFIGESIPPLIEFIKQFAQANEEAFGGIRDTVMTVFTTIWGYIQEVWQYIMEIWNEYGPQLTVLAETIFGTIRDVVQFVFETVWNIIKTILDLLVPYIKDVLGRIAEFWAENGEQIMKAVDNAFTFIKGVIDFIMPIVTGIIKGAWDIITAIFNTTIGVIMGIIKWFASLLTGDFEGMKEAAIGIVETMWDGIKGVIAGAWNLVSGAFSGLWDSISGWFSGLKDDALEWGKNMISGFIDGIKSMGSNVASAAGDVVKKAGDFLKFWSPAKKGEGRYIVHWGRNMIDGFLDGVKEEGRKAGAVMDGVIANMQPRNPIDIAGQVASTNASLNSRISHEINNSSNIENLLNLLYDALNRQQVIVLDSGELVGATTEKYNESLGDNSRSKMRWSL